MFWTIPDENEKRDDQGIGITNPDTGMLQQYNLAGAYDSNVALSITSQKISRRFSQIEKVELQDDPNELLEFEDSLIEKSEQKEDD